MISGIRYFSDILRRLHTLFLLYRGIHLFKTYEVFAYLLNTMKKDLNKILDIRIMYVYANYIPSSRVSETKF